ncbi:MAG: hypothetical protein QM756_15120 [Polyangiaceae bacterium]
MLRTLSPIVLLCIFAWSCADAGKRHARSGDDAEDESSESSEGDGERRHSKKGEDKAVPEPEFSEGMSVNEATKAVPSGIERRNIDQETLGKPLQDMSVYEPCKPGSSRVKLKVAVWDGRAVGIDVITTPKNEKLASCIKQRLAEVKWEKKVKSLNTIEYQL